jgi:hypothetical protein
MANGDGSGDTGSSGYTGGSSDGGGSSYGGAPGYTGGYGQQYSNTPVVTQEAAPDQQVNSAGSTALNQSIQQDGAIGIIPGIGKMVSAEQAKQQALTNQANAAAGQLPTRPAPGGSTPNYQSMTSPQLSSGLQSADATSANDSSEAWNEIANALVNVNTTLSKASTTAASGWEGEAANSAMQFHAQVANWTNTTAAGAQVASVNLYNQSTAVSSAKSSMPTPYTYTMSQAITDVMSSPDPIGAVSTAQSNLNKAAANQQESAQTATTYQQSLVQATQQMPAMTTTPSFSDASSSGSGTGSGVGAPGAGGSGSGSGGGSAAPSLSGGSSAGGSGSGGSGSSSSGGYSAPPTTGSGTGGTGSTSSGSGSSSSGSGTGTAGFNPGGSLTDPSGTGTGGTGVNGGGSQGGVNGMPIGGMPMGGTFGSGGGDTYLPSSGYGGGSSGGSAGGGYGSSSSGFGPGGDSASGSGASGSGAAGARSAAGASAAEDSAIGSGAAGARGATGSSSSGMGSGGRGGQKGQGDGEHKRASYLVEADPDSIFGTDERTAPPVIGG